MAGLSPAAGLRVMASAAAGLRSRRPLQPQASAAAGVGAGLGTGVAQECKRHWRGCWTRHWRGRWTGWAPAEQVGTGVGAGRIGVEQALTWALESAPAWASTWAPSSHPRRPRRPRRPLAPSRNPPLPPPPRAPPRSRSPPPRSPPPRRPPRRPPRSPSYMRTLLHKRNPASCNAVTSLSKRFITLAFQLSGPMARKKCKPRPSEGTINMKEFRGRVEPICVPNLSHQRTALGIL